MEQSSKLTMNGYANPMKFRAFTSEKVGKTVGNLSIFGRRNDVKKFAQNIALEGDVEHLN